MKKLVSSTIIALGALATALPAMAQELTFWSWRQEDKAQYQKFISAFETKNPGITVKFETFEATNYNTILSTALAGGSGPDLMFARAYGGLENVANAGYLLPLDKTNVPALEKFAPAAVAAETARSSKITYAVPFASQTMLVIYNKDIFDKNGLKEPETFDELVKASEKLKAAGIMPFGNGTATAWQNEVMVGGIASTVMGRGFYDDLMAGKADFTDKRYIEALTKLKEITKYFPDGFIGLDYASSQQLFASGMAGMFVGGSYELSNFKKQNPAIKMGIFAMPGLKAGDETLVAQYFDGGYAVNAKTTKKEAALKFVNFLASQEFGQMFADDLNNISAVPGVNFKDPLLAEVAELNKHSIPYIMLVHFRYGEPSGSVLLQGEIQKLFGGKATPEEVGKNLTTGLAAWYAPFKK
ncbi:N-Acetyl-D-glucosamine ABC transport system sugar-binding protein [Neorhizobium galegae bv. officinalis]|uniref:N-Acetyl-D-glucosamine ABC transport system sugar-binding protein n=1 Tax=Neorhizobium galegae bv. officinalis TaxID=323656 RepID=A0A0T7FVX1_NEOGA|nr:extracellular solute-binding protein [Neorhizobium galegae]CDZ39161.1 N-Acetyl-D-glucosamine ABC transport system sugar-binding protein [Neorhizobium galegae bv. officinalis]